MVKCAQDFIIQICDSLLQFTMVDSSFFEKKLFWSKGALERTIRATTRTGREFERSQDSYLEAVVFHFQNEIETSIVRRSLFSFKTERFQNSRDAGRFPLVWLMLLYIPFCFVRRCFMEQTVVSYSVPNPRRNEISKKDSPRTWPVSSIPEPSHAAFKFDCLPFVSSISSSPPWSLDLLHDV